MKHDKTFITIGAHAKCEREKHDFYSTDPRAAEQLLANVKFHGGIYEPCCGKGCLSIPLAKAGYNVLSADKFDHGFGMSSVDFFQTKKMPDGYANIVSNPPYNRTTDFICHALDILQEGGVLALFLKTQYLEGIERYERIYKKNPPTMILQYINRVSCLRNAGVNDDFGVSAVAYAWYVWVKGYRNETKIKWVRL